DADYADDCGRTHDRQGIIGIDEPVPGGEGTHSTQEQQGDHEPEVSAQSGPTAQPRPQALLPARRLAPGRLEACRHGLGPHFALLWDRRLTLTHVQVLP